MRATRVKVLFSKELLEYRRDPATLSSLMVLPIVFGVFFPGVFLIFMRSEQAAIALGHVSFFMEQVVAVTNVPYENLVVAASYLVLMKILIPLFLLIPVVVGATLAGSSFAGEKTEKTIEGILFTPLSARELVIGKIVASFFPSVLIAWITAFIYSIVVGILGYPLFGEWVFMDVSGFFMIVIMVPLVAFLAVAVVVEVSQKAKTMKAAQSISGLLVLPILAFIAGQAAGVILIGWSGILIMCAILLVVDVVFLIWTVRFNPVNLL